MTEQIGSAGSGHPNLNLSPEERRVYEQLLKEADPDGFGAVSGDIAVKFFERTKLPPDVLGQIWQIADTDNRGFLGPSGFGVVLRLIGHAQSGRSPSAQLATQVASLPRFDPIPGQSQAQAPPPQPPAQQQQPTPPAPPASPQPTGQGPVRVPALAPDKVAQYSSFFDKSGAENGLLSGVAAKQIFEEAGLPNEVLGRVWGLSDMQGRGSLDVTEFVVAMHLLASYKSGAMRGVPSTLPPGLYDAAARRTPVRVGGGSRPSSSAFPAPGITPQFSGNRGRPTSPIARQNVGTPLSTQSTGETWLVSAADKAKFDQIFNGIDRAGAGFLSGEQAVEFFGNARLPEEVLAQIWDLADINSEGRLNKDEFAVAMYLIRQQRGTRDGRGILPNQLPPALIPPSMRKQQPPPPQPTAPAFENATITKPRSAADDLFGLDAFGPPPPAQPQVAQGTGSTDAGPFANPPAVTSSPVTSSTFKPFIPSSSFGQSLNVQQTGSPSPNQTRSPPPVSDDLLGDTDPTESSKLTNETSELANLSNQVSSLSSQMGELSTTRGQTEQELSQQASQKRAFESRLGQLRTMYEKEVKEVKALKDQLATAKNDTKRLQSDMAVIDGSHQDLSTQHQQIRAAFEADQRENAQLKERIRQLNTEVDQLKPQLEKLKSDARQQKGLVAINKKQLATNEAERDRIKAEIAAAQKEADDAAREIQDSQQQIEASKRELEEAQNTPVPVKSPPPAAVASPAPSTSSNPFFRRTTTDTSTRGSQDATTENKSNFDNIFGPSFGTPSGTPAPATSFRGETPQTSTPPGAPHIESSRAESVTPQVVEPPPPTSANQINSSALPFRDPLSRADSISSSVQVAAPASRLSPVETPRALTPSTATSTPPASRPDDDPFAPSAQDEEQDAVRQTIPTGDRSADEIFGKATDDLSPIPGAFPDGETPRAETPGQPGDKSSLAIGAGAAALAAGAGVAVASTLNGDDKGKAPEKPQEQTNFDEYFGGPAHQRTPSEQAADFDSAFASMGKEAPTNGSSQPRQEFPDIQELPDDESSSEDESPMRFDDNFSSPQKNTEPAAVAPQEESKTETDSLQPPRPVLGTASSTASSLPGFETQSSPPTYQSAVPADDPNHFPREYKNLLPERETPTSPPPADQSSVQSPSYGPEIGHAQNADDTKPPAPPPKSSPFDFDSAFAGVGAAQVDDESDEEDALPTPKTQAPEFDPTFDTPVQSRSTTAASNLPPPVQANGSPQPPPKDDFFDFNATNTRPTQAAAVTDANAAGPVSHDWDDIFSGLSSKPAVNTGFDDEPAPAPTSATDIQSPTSIYSPQSPPIASPTDVAPNALTQTISIGPDVNAYASAASVDNSKDPSPGPPEDTIQPTPSITLAAPTSPGLPPPRASETTAATDDRPPLGRAISTTSEHDDPILKRLTAMGWSRAESLSALERFDYNIDKAADYLTFRS